MFGRPLHFASWPAGTVSTAQGSDVDGDLPAEKIQERGILQQGMNFSKHKCRLKKFGEQAKQASRSNIHPLASPKAAHQDTCSPAV